MSYIKTIKIKSTDKPGEYIIINLCDFDPEKHSLFEDFIDNPKDDSPDNFIETISAGETIEPRTKRGRPAKQE